MTRDEIRLLTFILLTLVVGASVRWWMRHQPVEVAIEEPAPRKPGWAQPPYVFKSRAHMEAVAAEVERKEYPRVNSLGASKQKTP